MDKRNIALVRATNIIPFDGIVRPVSQVPYLTKNMNNAFTYELRNLLERKGLLPEFSYEEVEESIAKTQLAVAEYLPYYSDYNSVVLWALNGLVPDDNEHGFANNVFSNKQCVIIDGFEEQLETGNIVSLMPTDTAIKGNVKLSSSAIILIEENRYNSLSDQEREMLNKLKLTVKTFFYPLREAVEKALLETKRFIPERPTLSRTTGNFQNSETSEETKATINSIAEEKSIPQISYFDILSNPFESVEQMEDEFDNIKIVQDFFQRQFLKFLFKRIDVDKTIQSGLLRDLEAEHYMKKLMVEIEKFGIDKYKIIVDQYNTILQKMKEEGTLPTPQQIVDSINKSENGIYGEPEQELDCDIF